MAEFAYNNAKYASIGHILFKLNYKYHPKYLFKDKTKLCSKSCSINKLVKELKELIKICCQNLHHA